MRAAVVQFNIGTGEIDINFARVKEEVAKLMTSPEPPTVITLPEFWSTGYVLDQCKQMSSLLGSREVLFLSELSRKYHVAFAGGSVLASINGRFFVNRAQVLDVDGRYQSWYDKINLFPPMEEDVYLTPGQNLQTFILDGYRCACIICYDLRFDDLLAEAAQKGVQVLFVSAEWPLSRINEWTELLKAAAVKHHLFVVACNCCGTTDKETFGGHSCIVAPDGTVLAQADEKPTNLCVVLDISNKAVNVNPKAYLQPA